MTTEKTNNNGIWGETMLQARGIIIDDLADNRGILVYECRCGKTFRGPVYEPTFRKMVFLHAETCASIKVMRATYPVEVGVDGVCPECTSLSHCPKGGRCKNVFLNMGGNIVDRCHRYAREHKLVFMGDSSMKRR